MLSARSKRGSSLSSVEWRPVALPAEVEELERAGYTRRMASLLARRGIETPAGAAAFLRPELEQLHDPHRLAGLNEAVERLLVARASSEGVALVGDYDVDGVSGAAILTAVFRACGIETHPILPHRMLDGYGFQPAHVEQARSYGAKVVVTVDCGTNSHAAAEAALDAGLDLVVTDHHLPDQPLPGGVLQINPRQEACSYPFADLSGAGLALKLAMALAEACGREVDPRILLRVACLGTIADLVPLRGENRVIAAIGLRELGRTRSPGLKALIDVARVQPPFSAADVGFRLAPRLNAPGRLDSAEKALDLILCRDPNRARDLAASLDRWNRERQAAERRVVDEARQAFAERSEAPAIHVAWDSSWHRGVVGVAAGRLARELNRPVILLGVQDGLATGSGRSVAEIHLHDFLAAWKNEMQRFGGHAQAIGLTVETERLADLRRRWEDAAETWRDSLAVKRYDYELELAASELTAELLAELVRLEPHGQGNPRPLIRVRGPMRLQWRPRIFGRGHLAAEALAEDGGRIPLLGWGWQERSDSLVGDFEVLGFLENDRLRGRVLRLVDARPFAAAALAESGS